MGKNIYPKNPHQDPASQVETARKLVISVHLPRK